MSALFFATAVITAISYFIRLEVIELKQNDEIQFHNENHHNRKTQAYDFIVVGAGTAGCVVASRLSEHGFRVLLLEAGGDPPSASEVPAFFRFVANSPDINYFYTSVPQKFANNRNLVDGTGKMMGGSGSHNGLVYQRGHPKDYDNWAYLTDDSSWRYENILSIFRDIETYKEIGPIAASHGSHGPIYLTPSARPINPIWAGAARELGYDVVDPNGPQRQGYSPSNLMTREGRRVSTYTAYLQPHLNRKTLTVEKYATVDRILFEGERAIGVEYFRHGVKLKAFASKEISISAGTYFSPILLMKSGIGPADILNQAEIPQRLELPAVGKNLQNHQAVLLGPFEVNDPSKLSSLYNNLTEVGFQRYLNYQAETVLSETGNTPQIVFVSREANKRGEYDWPDLEYNHLVPNLRSSGINLPNQFFVAVVVTRPEYNIETLGTVSLNISSYLRGSTENSELSQIDFKFLTSKQDYNALRDGIDLAFAIFNTKAFKSIGTRYIQDEECIRLNKFDSNGYWNCYIGKTGTVWVHPAGTCRMGFGPHDRNSVVDSKLRLHGIKGLRVVDASIMPQVTNSNTNAPVILIAEKASADIISTYRPSSQLYLHNSIV